MTLLPPSSFFILQFSQIPDQTIVTVPSPCPPGHVLEQSPEGLYLCRCNSVNTDILDCGENGQGGGLGGGGGGGSGRGVRDNVGGGDVRCGRCVV